MLNRGTPTANSPIVLLATITAPAFFSLVTIVASRCGMKFLNTSDP